MSEKKKVGLDIARSSTLVQDCLLYTSDAADEL